MSRMSAVNALLLAVCVALSTALVVSVVAPFQPPQHEQQQSNPEQKAESKTAEHKPAKSLWERTHEDAVAFYTFVLSCFTGLLVIVTATQIGFLIRADKTARMAAEAAILSAKAAIGMELPIIRADRVPGLINVAKPPSPEAPFLGGVYVQGIPNRYSVIQSIDLKNFGRTPAFPIKLVAGWKVVKVLPDEPDYFHSINSSATAIINPDSEFTAAVRGVVELTPEQLETLHKQTAFIWLYISLHYRDFMNAPHEARFCWRFTRGFGPGGSLPIAYTTHT